jgi:hypothetical protein
MGQRWITSVDPRHWMCEELPMDDVRKSRIRLAHWIEHNLDHLKGYEEVAKILENEGASAAAECIRHGIRNMEAANKEFDNALALLPAQEPATAGTSKEACEGHDHHHDHEDAPGHAHSHEHKHDHNH